MSVRAALLLVLLAAFPAGAQEMSEHEVYVYSRVEGVELRALVARPPGWSAGDERPAVVIVHGGGWAIGEPEWGLGRAHAYRDLGLVAVSLQYRLSKAGSGVTPLEAMADVRAGVRWVRENAVELGVDPRRLAGYGWSAGAHLLASAAIFPDGDGPGEPSCVPDALVLSSPAVALERDVWLRRILGERAAPEDISPVLHVRPGLPPTLLLQGRTDTVTPLADTKRFHQALLAAGNDSRLVVYDGVGHLFTPSDEPDDGWPNPDPQVRAAAYEEAVSFLRSLGFAGSEVGEDG